MDLQFLSAFLRLFRELKEEARMMHVTFAEGMLNSVMYFKNIVQPVLLSFFFFNKNAICCSNIIFVQDIRQFS